MNIEQIANTLEIAIHKLPYMETLYRQIKDQAEKMQCTIQRLANETRALEYKISILDKTAFSCEQDCRRRYQQLQELIDKKDRMQKLIANILNDDNEGYSKLKQIVKENVKEILSEKRVLISISFAAVIKTLKDNPQMANIIYNASIANDGEQHNDNNITKYLEFNKDSLLDLAEKLCENLVEALTNDAVNNAVASTFNLALSLSQSSSTFPSPSMQNDTYRIEESETYHNCKGDLAD
jgi:hypothetical protein